MWYDIYVEKRIHHKKERRVSKKDLRCGKRGSRKGGGSARRSGGLYRGNFIKFPLILLKKVRAAEINSQSLYFFR